MIWFDIKTLEEKLLNYQISEKTGYYYLLAFFVLAWFSSGEGDSYKFESLHWNVVNFLTVLFFIVWGTRKVYYINQKGGDKDFLKRYFSMAFVHMMRIGVILLGLAFIINLITEFLPGYLPDFLHVFSWNDPTEFIQNLILQIAFYSLLIRSFKRINKA